MKSPDFDYCRPADLDAVIALLVEHDGEAAVLAGGQSLMPMMNFRLAAPTALIDLVDVEELRGVTQDGDNVRIGAMTRYVELMGDPIIQKAVPLFGLALPHVAHEAIRNRGTIGGSLALADPAAEMPALALALDAKIEVVGPDGTRLINADDFFLGMYETALKPEEVILAVHIPAATQIQSFGFHELTQRHGDYALAGAVVVKTADTYRVSFFGVSDCAVRVPALEDVLGSGEDIRSALTHLSAIDFAGDTKANSTTRERLAGVALKRAIEGMIS